MTYVISLSAKEVRIALRHNPDVLENLTVVLTEVMRFGRHTGLFDVRVRVTHRRPARFPKRAPALGLRPDVLTAWTRAAHGNVDALAEVPARVAAAWTINGRREGRHEVRTCASVLLGKIE
jgi:hypothetical protein